MYVVYILLYITQLHPCIYVFCKYLGFSEGITQEWISEAGDLGAVPPEAIGCWIFEVPQHILNDSY